MKVFSESDYNADVIDLQSDKYQELKESEQYEDEDYPEYDDFTRSDSF